MSITKEARGLLCSMIRLHLDGLSEGKVITTRELMEALYPMAAHDIKVRNLYVETAMKLGKGELAGSYCTRAPADPKRKFMGKPIRRMLWHAFHEGARVNLCPTCNQVMP